MKRLISVVLITVVLFTAGSSLTNETTSAARYNEEQNYIPYSYNTHNTVNTRSNYEPSAFTIKALELAYKTVLWYSK
jgi:hypothetical protein